MLTFRSVNEKNSFKVYINDILHMEINQNNFNTLRSWKISPNLDPDPFFIEIKSNGSNTIYQYDTMEKWVAILKELDKMTV
jgi:hypothetical protein